MNRQKVILTALLVLFAITLVVSYFRMPKQKRVDKLEFVSGMTVEKTKRIATRSSDDTRVHLELLDRTPLTAVSVRRNIFSDLFAVQSKKPIIPLPPPPPPPPPKPVVVAPREEERPAPPAVAEPTPLQRDLARFTFLGFLKKDNRKTIFLSNDKEIFLVKKGDKISGKYDVTALTDEALTISSMQDGGEIIIPLMENRPLSAPKR